MYIYIYIYLEAVTNVMYVCFTFVLRLLQIDFLTCLLPLGPCVVLKLVTKRLTFVIRL